MPCIDSDQKPYVCATCGKRFARSDTHLRHIKSTHPEYISTRERTQIACDSCHANKVKCTGGRPPCRRCAAKNIICTSHRAPRGLEEALRDENAVSTREYEPPAITVDLAREDSADENAGVVTETFNDSIAQAPQGLGADAPVASYMQFDLPPVGSNMSVQRHPLLIALPVGSVADR